MESIPEEKSISSAPHTRYCCVWIETMEMKLNRRTFLIVLGVTAAVAAAPRTRRASARPALPGERCFFVESCPPQPAARPRSAAIAYLPS